MRHSDVETLIRQIFRTTYSIVACKARLLAHRLCDLFQCQFPQLSIQTYFNIQFTSTIIASRQLQLLHAVVSRVHASMVIIRAYVYRPVDGWRLPALHCIGLQVLQVTRSLRTSVHLQEKKKLPSDSQLRAFAFMSLILVCLSVIQILLLQLHLCYTFFGIGGLQKILTYCQSCHG